MNSSHKTIKNDKIRKYYNGLTEDDYPRRITKPIAVIMCITIITFFFMFWYLFNSK